MSRFHRPPPTSRASSACGTHSGDDDSDFRGLPAYPSWLDPSTAAVGISRAPPPDIQESMRPPVHPTQQTTFRHPSHRPSEASGSGNGRQRRPGLDAQSHVSKPYNLPRESDAIREIPPRREYENPPAMQQPNPQEMRLPAAERAYRPLPYPYANDSNNRNHLSRFASQPSAYPSAPGMPYMYPPDDATPPVMYYVRQPVDYAWDELYHLRQQFTSLQDTVSRLDREMSELRLNRFDHHRSHNRSSTPSLAPSDSISHVSADDPTSELHRAYKRLVQGDAVKPPHLPDTVLWTLATAQSFGSVAGISKRNQHRPSFKRALRDANGLVLEATLVKFIKRTASSLANQILLAHPLKPGADIARIRDYFRTKHPKLWYGAIVLLEERHPEVALCSAHWKADHLLGQSMTLLSKLSKKGRRHAANKDEIDIDSDSSESNDDRVPDVTETPRKAKRPANVITPLQAAPSKRNRLAKPTAKFQPSQDNVEPPPGASKRGESALVSPPPSEPSNSAAANPPVVNLPTPQPLLPPSASPSLQVPSPSIHGGGTLDMIKTDKDFDNLRYVIESPELTLAPDVISIAMDLLDAMENNPTHGSHGFPSDETSLLLHRVQSADPAAFDDEDQLNESWGHWQWSSGNLTIASVITSWKSIGSTDIARQLIAAALNTCKCARYLCIDLRPQPRTYLSDSYFERLVTTLLDVWKRSGGPMHKGKMPAHKMVPRVDRMDDMDAAPINSPDDTGGTIHATPDAADEPTSAVCSLESLFVTELRQLAAKKQIAGVRNLPKAACVSALMESPNPPTAAEISEFIMKRAPKKSKPSKPSKSVAVASAATVPTSTSAAPSDTDDIMATPRAPRIISTSTHA